MPSIYYSLIGFVAILMQLIINHQLLFSKEKVYTVASNTYRMFISAVLAYYLFDFMWGIASVYNATQFLYVDTIFYHISMAVSVVLWCKYVSEYLNLNYFVGKVVNTIGFFLCVTEIIFLIRLGCQKTLFNSIFLFCTLKI